MATSTKHLTESGRTIYLMPDTHEDNFNPRDLDAPYRGIYELEVEGNTFRLEMRRERLTPRAHPEQTARYDLYLDDPEAVGGRRWFKGRVTRKINRIANRRVIVEVSAIFPGA